MSQRQPATSVNERTPVPDGHPAPDRARVALPALWFGLFGGPFAWSAQTIVNLAVASHACFPRLSPVREPSVAGLRAIVFAVSLVAVLTCATAMAVAWRAWSKTRGEHQGGAGRATAHDRSTALLETGEGRTRFMALAGLLTSVTFLVVSGAHAATVFLVSPCTL